MSDYSLSEILIEKFGKQLFKKSLDFPTNKINIISLKENPLKIRCIILDDDREFHLIINKNKNEIFHDCPTFLIHNEKKDKICNHIVKIFLTLREDISLKLLRDFDNYILTSEDFGSEKKSKNFLILANSCFESNNCIEGLNYLNKAIINQFECEAIIEKYLIISLNNNLFIEFFEFIKAAYENDLDEYIKKYDSYIEKGFKLFLNAVSKYNFFNILRVIEYIDKIFDRFQNLTIITSLHDKLAEMSKSKNINDKYFSIYFVKRYFEELVKFNPLFKNIISNVNYELFKEEILNYFLNEIESFSIIDKIKLMKKHFEIFQIPKDRYYNDYKKYKNEIKELERKVYLKKFAFLKLFIEHYNIKKTKVEFRKKRNTYIVTHNNENLDNPAYKYIIRHIGFYGINDSTIKSSEIGINYLIIKELFLDDLTNFPDIFYYRKQFWGESEEYKIKDTDGFSLLTKPINYYYNIDQNFSNINDVLIIEWDLANKPRQGSIVNAYGSQIIIPDQNNPLYHDLKPFDLCYCQKNPVKIEGNLIKTINVITICSFNDAIYSVSKGMEYIEGFYPLSLVNSVLNKKINPFEAEELVFSNLNKLFVPNYHQFIDAFRDFLIHFINKERNYIYDELKSNPEENVNQILSLLNLTTELAGLKIPYSKIMKKLLNEEIDLKPFRFKLLNEVHSYIKNTLKKKEKGATKIFNLKKMRHTPFIKYSDEILEIRRQELENSTIYKNFDENNNVIYDITDVYKTYYGYKFSKILNLKNKNSVNQDIIIKFKKYASKLNIKLNIISTIIK